MQRGEVNTSEEFVALATSSSTPPTSLDLLLAGPPPLSAQIPTRERTLFSSMQSRCHTPSPGILIVRQMMCVERLDGRMMQAPTDSSPEVSLLAASCMLMFLKSACEMGRTT